MNPLEQEKFIELQQTIISKDLKAFYKKCVLEELSLDRRMSMRYFEDEYWRKDQSKKVLSQRNEHRIHTHNSDSSRRDDLSSSTNSSFFCVSSDHDDGTFDCPTGNFLVLQNKKEASIGYRFTLNQKRAYRKEFGRDAKIHDIKEKV